MITRMNTANTNIHIDPLRLEKKEIFNASLKLLNEGKFHATSMNEIAFYAKLTESTIHYIFESREKLLEELSQNLTSEIIKTVKEADKNSILFKDKFLSIWNALYQYYLQAPAVISF